MKQDLSFNSIQKQLKTLSDEAIAARLKTFFQVKKGGYAENDLFRGIYVPQLRAIVRKTENISFRLIYKLLHSKYHEDRMLGLLFLIKLYENADNQKCQKKIVNFYLKNISCVNSWDLVDISAPNILGKYLLKKHRKILFNMAYSNNMWERRIAIVATLAFIRQRDFQDALLLAGILLQDKEALIQKATGWILREIGKRDKQCEVSFLRKHIKIISPITLSYATERLAVSEKQAIYKLYYEQKRGHRV